MEIPKITRFKSARRMIMTPTTQKIRNKNTIIAMAKKYSFAPNQKLTSLQTSFRNYINF